ncbi:hypothetical protein [Candidatus Villigracilis saccharophilus]|uniref:hypothetical protein n=1 Tax=Candidatus Villigracilis saccharophilus TaxID=3140684 RepID=UPI0031366C6C|nr:hypothetical protein [Anaerolineales bacterium]
MTDSTTTKTHMVTNLAVQSVDVDTDQVFGVADPAIRSKFLFGHHKTTPLPGGMSLLTAMEAGLLTSPSQWMA